MIFSKNTNGAEFLIVCLGNPGDKYTYTRHNAGFLCGDYIADKKGFEFNKIKFKANYGMCDIDGHKCIFFKPQTFMNESGNAVGPCASYFKIPPENVIVISDDITLDVGKMRIRRKGSAGGHNGLKSIISHLGTDAFPRIKIGIGDRADKSADLADYVLDNFSKKDMETLKEIFENAYCSLRLMIGGDIDSAMGKFN